MGALGFPCSVLVVTVTHDEELDKLRGDQLRSPVRPRFDNKGLS